MFRSFGARLLTALVLGALFLSAVAAPAAAASKTRYVDNDNRPGDGPAACNHANFSSIQGAINASAAWDKVYVCPGNYQEEITIDVRGLEVRSVPALGARIWAPPTLTDLGGVTAVVHITARDVMFVGFWLKFQDGDIGPIIAPPVRSITTDCELVDAAIWAEAPHATIKANHIKTVGDNTLSGECGYLFGIVLADVGIPEPGGGAWGPDTSLIWRNWVKDFKAGGILTGGNRSVRVFNNNIRYVHYYDPATCNLVPVLGIRAGVDAQLDYPCIIPTNAVNTSPLDGFFPYSVGILAEGGLVDFRGNTVLSTLDTSVAENPYGVLGAGIIMADVTDGSKARSNIVDNVFFGFVVTDDEFFLPAALPKPEAPDGVAVSGNRVQESFYSFYVDADDCYYYANRAHINFLGMIVDAESANNTFDHNDFRYNLEIDCADESYPGGSQPDGTNNFWVDPNLGFQSYPEEICMPFFPILI